MTEFVTPRLLDGERVADDTNGFTIGRRYEVVRRTGYQGCLGIVINDNGHERAVDLAGGPSAHIKRRRDDRVVGYFEYLWEIGS